MVLRRNPESVHIRQQRDRWQSFRRALLLVVSIVYVVAALNWVGRHFTRRNLLAAITSAAAAAEEQLSLEHLTPVGRRPPELLSPFPQLGRIQPYQAYDFGSVSSLLNSSRQILEEPLDSVELVPMLDYIWYYYPDQRSLPVQTLKGYERPIVTDVVAALAVSQARAVASAIRAMDDYSVDLTVQTKPEQEAGVRLESRDGTRHSGTTNTVFKNVYRGLYLYTVSKIGMKPIGDKYVNLVDDSRPILDCTLVPLGHPGEALECNRR